MYFLKIFKRSEQILARYVKRLIFYLSACVSVSNNFQEFTLTLIQFNLTLLTSLNVFLKEFYLIFLKFNDKLLNNQLLKLFYQNSCSSKYIQGKSAR